jgi:Ca2+-binding EF-hand superfamily protein
MKHSAIFYSAAMALLIASPAFAGHDGHHGDREKGGMIEKLDLDGDGNITKEEFLSRHMEKFNELDANGDETISKEELSAFHESRQQERQSKMFQMMDDNGDGMVSEEEMRAHRENVKGMHKQHGDMHKDEHVPPAE